MKRKHMIKSLLLLLLITIVVACGITYAFMHKKTEKTANTFTPATVSCDVKEVFDDSVKSSIVVENTGNVDAYIRVQFLSYWVDGDGNIVGKASVLPDISCTENWMRDGDTYYCVTEVAPQDDTPELLKESVLLTEETYNGKVVYQVLEVVAQAIQADPDSAVEAAWTRVKVDTDGKLNLISK